MSAIDHILLHFEKTPIQIGDNVDLTTILLNYTFRFNRITRQLRLNGQLSDKSGQPSGQPSDKSDDSTISETTIPIKNRFPPTWKTVHFHELNDTAQLWYAQEIFDNTNVKQHCNTFRGKTASQIYNRLHPQPENMLLNERFIMVVDTELQLPYAKLIGFIWYDEYITLDNVCGNIHTGMTYLVIHTIWSCSFTQNDHLAAHYTAKKQEGYDISVAKFVKHQVFVNAKKKLTRQLNGYYIDTIKIDYIMTTGCSLPSSIERHEKNGARRITVDMLSRLVALKPRRVVHRLRAPRKDPHNVHPLTMYCDDNEIPMYWMMKVGNIPYDS